MKKVLYSILLTLFVLFPVSVFAKGYVSVSPSSLTITEGSSKTFKITAYDTIGDFYIKSNNTAVASVNTKEWGTGMVEEKQTKTKNVTVTGKSVGKTTITLTMDAATFDGDDLSKQTKTITVNVVAKPKPSEPKPEKNLSKNNTIKSLSIEGYELVKVDKKNYTLTVTNDVTSINVKATAEDAKAKITGAGKKDLKVGVNNIKVVVTSESGAKNEITIKVTRKDGYYLEDLDIVLKNDNLKDSNIILKSDSKISKEHINKIKENKKELKLNYYDKNKKLLYSWTLNGKNINETKEFSTLITFTSENVKDIYKSSNYADGLYVNFDHNGELPTGTKVKIYVGDKFENGNIVNIYHYDKTEKKLNFVMDGIEVVDGYVEFDVEHCSEYFVTMSIIKSTEKENIVKEPVSSPNIFMIISIVELVIIIGLIAFMFIKSKSNKKDNSNIEKPSTLETNNYNNYNSVKPNQESSANLNNNINSIKNNVSEIQIIDEFYSKYNNNNNNNNQYK